MNKRLERFWRAYGSEERVRWMRRQPSVVSGNGPCVNAHIRPSHRPPSGMGRKGDACWIVPLTFDEHNELHQIGQQTFETKYDIDLTLEAIDTDSRWKRYEHGLEA